MSLIGQTADSDQVKTCSKCGEEKPLVAFRQAPRYKLGVRGQCKICETVASSKWAKENKERRSDIRKRSYYKHHEANLAYKKKYDEENRDRNVKYSRQWRAANPDKNAQQEARRRATKREQTPELTPEEQQHIQDIYWLAKDLRAVTGEEYHVDHIIPLAKGGLHHPDNLQVLPADLNLKKGAKV